MFSLTASGSGSTADTGDIPAFIGAFQKIYRHKQMK